MKGKRLGPYRIFQLLGRGGMGKVYMAEVAEPVHDLPTGRTVALKVLHANLQHDRDALDRFLQEARLGRRVRHDNVVQTYECDVARLDRETYPYIVMEYVEGQTLRALCTDLGRVPEELCRHVGRELAKGLRAIHESGAVHRDLKPDNVLITEKHVVKIMDLGVARLRDEAAAEGSETAFIGSISYASPEQIRGPADAVDGRADLHALGVILYELATGQHPYRDEDRDVMVKRILEEDPRRAGSLNPQISPFLEELIHTLLAKDALERFSTAHELLLALEDGELSQWWVRRASSLRLETRRPLRRIRVQRETKVFGRDEELAELEAAWEAVRGGDGKVVFIEGEAGIGKTRLVDDFVGGMQERGEALNFVFGPYLPGGAATAAGAFATAYREHFGAEGLEQTLPDYLAPVPALVPAFAALLRGEPAPEDTPMLSKEALQTTFVHATRALAAERPTIVLIDDLHFAPAEGRALFAALALAVPGHRILLVGTMRRGVPEPWVASVERLEHASRIVLSRLGPKHLVHLLEEAFHSKRLAEELGVKIALKSDGNPFFVFEIIRDLRDDEAIVSRPDGTWITTRTILDLKAPTSLVDLVRSRISELSDEERYLLEVASCCGFEFDGALVAEAVGWDRIPTFRRLGQLETRHRLVRSAGRGFEFDHHQVQEGLYDSLSPVLREEYHVALGTAIERRQGVEDRGLESLDGGVAVQLCEHFFAGSRADHARKYLQVALDHLKRSYQNEHGAALAERALAVPGLLGGTERIDVLLHRATCLDRLGRREEQEVVAQEAVALAGEEADGVLRARSLSILGMVYGQTGRFEEAEKVVREARECARIAGDRWGAGRASGNLGVLLADLGRNAEALELHEHALAAARETGKLAMEARGLGNLGTTLLALGRLGEARACFERQLKLAEETRDLRNQAYASGCLGSVLTRIGRYEEALARFQRQRELDRAAGSRRGEAVAHGSMGVVHLDLGRYTDAREHGEHQQQVAQEIGDRWSETRAAALLSTVALDLGRFAEARARASAWLDLAREIGDRVQEGWALHTIGLLALARDDAVTAHRMLDDALAVRRTLDDRYAEASDRLVLSEVSMREGDVEVARTYLEDALEDAREEDVPGVRMVASAGLALAGGLGAEEALGELDACEVRAPVRSRVHAHWLLWQITADEEHLAEAYRLVQHMRKHAPEEAQLSVVENVTLNREVEAAWRLRHPSDDPPPR